MSSQKGNVHRSRPQKHRNVTAYRNNKYECSATTKKLNSKLHDGVCQHCKDVLEWRVKYSKFKPLSQPKKCVKCLQKTVRDSYHIICKPCAMKLEVCAKCGKNEEIVLPILKEPQATETQSSTSNQESENTDEEDDLDFDLDLGSSDDEENTKKKEMCKKKTPVSS
ncbi:uncharacterized protein C9orf85 homolog [Discoglossus pictus]